MWQAGKLRRGHKTYLEAKDGQLSELRCGKLSRSPALIFE
jgi:hypothetical protein